MTGKIMRSLQKKINMAWISLDLLGWRPLIAFYCAYLFNSCQWTLTCMPNPSAMLTGALLWMSARGRCIPLRTLKLGHIAGTCCVPSDTSLSSPASARLHGLRSFGYCSFIYPVLNVLSFLHPKIYDHRAARSARKSIAKILIIGMEMHIVQTAELFKKNLLQV